MGKSRTTQRDINAAERSSLALRLRKMGLSLDEIAKQCGYQDKSGAHRAIKRELERLPVEDALDLRKIEALRLDQVYAECSALFFDRNNEKRLFAVDRMLSISEARRKLLGLDTRPEEDLAQTSYTKRVILTHQFTVEEGGTPGASNR
jgi:DNA-binding transcriptional MerR regulator